MSTADKYLRMRNSGSSPEHIYLALKADGVGEIESIRILRELFQLSMMEAKEVIVTTDLPVDSLEVYQEKIYPTVKRAIEITDREDANSGGIGDKNS